MNSTLSQFLATPGAASTAAPQLNAAALAGLLSAPSAAPAVGEGPVPTPADFSSLMPVATTATASLITVSPLLPAQPPVVMPATSAPAAPAVVASQITGGSTTAPAPNRRFTTTSAASSKSVQSEPASNTATIQIPSWSRGAPAPVGVDSGAKAPRLQLTAPATTEVPEEIREQAVAFVASLLQSLLPEATVPSLLAPDSTSVGQQATTPLPVSVPETSVSPSIAPLSSEQVTPMKGSTPNSAVGADLGPPFEDGPWSAATQKTGFETKTNQGFRGVTLPAPEAVQASNAEKVAPSSAPATVPAPSFVVTEDGTLEFKISLPSPAVAELKADQQKFSDTAVEFQAELEVPGQPLVRVESAGFSAEVADDVEGVKTGVADAAAAVPPTAQENFAAKNRPEKISLDSTRSVGERNFEFTGDKQVTSRSLQAGITVAKTDSNMPAAPTEEPRAARNTPEPLGLPVRAEFQVAQAPAERITAPAPASSGSNFAERAVETVTGLIDAQFSASMQKTGSVQLRLQFGGEDLSVRVEIRDGAVHTDFRTDSAPLRAALEREWQTVAAASPAQMQRYVEPVFSPGAAHSSPSSSAHGDGRQQPQHQAGADDQQRTPREGFSDHPAFNRRSLVSESFIPEPSVPRVAAFLPTSLRLSALA